MKYKRLNPFSLYLIFTNWKCCKAIINSLFCLSPLFSPVSIFLCFPSAFFLRPTWCCFFFSLLRAEHESDFLDRLCSPRRFCSIPPSWWTCRVTTRFLLETRLHWEESKDGERTHRDINKDTDTHTLTVVVHHLISFWDGVWLSLLEALLT